MSPKSQVPVALGLTEPLTEMSRRNLLGALCYERPACVGLAICSSSCTSPLWILVMGMRKTEILSLRNLRTFILPPTSEALTSIASPASPLPPNLIAFRADDGIARQTTL
jgi:hypothetical protein